MVLLFKLLASTTKTSLFLAGHALVGACVPSHSSDKFSKG